MFLNFSNAKDKEKESKNFQKLESKDKNFSSIKKNILELYFDNFSQNPKKKLNRRSESEPNLKYKKKNLKKTKLLQDEIENNKIISKNEEENNSNELNEEDEKPINLNNLMQEINKEQKNNEILINNKDKINNGNIISNNNIFKPRLSRDSKDLIEKIIYNNGGLLNINEKSSNNDILNLNNKYSSNEISSHNNSNQNLNPLNYYSNSNTNKSNTNYAFNFFGINIQEDNSSLNSSKNELSSKNLKINNNNNNHIGNLSTSSFGKNFVLKSEICKSTFHNEKNYYKNNNNNSSEGNPIMTYFKNDININDKNFGNFYLFTDRKSVEEVEQNQYLDFFPFDENNSKKKEKNIMSCNYIDSNNEIPEKINTGIINENDDNSGKYNFILNEFSIGENKEEKLNLQTLIKNFGDNNKNNNNIAKNNKSKIDTISECYSMDKNINKLTNRDNGNKRINNKISNIQTENNNKNKYDFNIQQNNDTNKINNTNININNQKNNFNNEQKSLQPINNIYNNINTNYYKHYQINPLMNSKMTNYFYNQNMNINPIMNYYNQNYQQYNFYNQQFFNQNNNIQNNDYFNSINNNPINIDNNKNINNNINNNKINNPNKNNNNIYNNNNRLLQNKNFYEYSDEEILNLSVCLINDQIGCRFMQEKIRGNQTFANELLFPKIKYNLKELCCDCFGNYFMQLLVEILSFDNINKFFDMTQNYFTEICISPHGTRVIQKIIDKISATPILMNRFIYNLNSKDLGIIFKSPYGNHMIQKVLTTIHSSEYSNFIFNYTYNNFLDIANSKHGVCVIQKCVSEGDEKQREKLYGLILNNFSNLIKDQYGNYLIQYILTNTKSEEKFKEIFPIILKIEENILNFCKSKYSANVIEKCFENSENMIREHILDSLLKTNPENIIDLLLDQYGIYVIQKALKMNNSLYKNKLIDIINSKEKELKEINFSDYKYKIILKVINSSKELGEILGKIINKNNINNTKINIENNNENNHYHNKNYFKGEDNRNEYFNYNNKGNNKRGKKYFRGYNNNY